MLKHHYKNITLVSLFALTRLFNFLKFPPFVDELLYWRWTKVISTTPAQFLLPLSEDGQPPLYFWIGSLLVKATSLDPLLILRLVSIIFGAATLLLLIKIGSHIHSSRFGYVLGILYTLYPMFLWHDRLAMRESMITIAGTLILFGLYTRFKQNLHNQGSVYLLSGVFLGLLTKGTALLFLPVIFSSYLYYFLRKQLTRHDYYVIWTLFLTLILVFLLAQSVIVKGSSFLLDPKVILSHLYLNLYSVARWLVEYSTLPLLILWVFGAFKLWGKNRSLLIWSLALFALTVGIEVVTAKIFFPRYFLWVMPLYLLPVGWGILELSNTALGKSIVILCLLPLLRFDYYLITNPLVAPLPAIDRWQYLSGWPSGYGIFDISQVIRNNSPDYLIVEKNEGCRTGVSYYNKRAPKLIDLSDYVAIQTALQSKQRVYLCLSKDYPPDKFKVNLISEVSRPGNESSIRLYELQSLYE